MERDVSSFAAQRTWRWRPNESDQDHYLAVETTEDGLRYFAWSHLDRGLTDEVRQTFAQFESDGPAWPLPEDIERRVREWLAERGR